MLKFDKKALLYGISAMSCSMLHCIFVSFYIDYFVRQNIMGMGGGGSDPKEGGVGGELGGGGNREQQRQVSTLNWFIVGQFVYATWNALNDLGFGWLSDTSYAKVKKIIGVGVAAKQSSPSSTPRFLKPILFTVKRFLPSTAALSRRRLSRVAIGGPLWAAAFAFLWYPAPFLRNISPALELSVKMIIYDGFFSYTTVSFRALLVDITTDGAQRELCNVYASIGHVIGSIGVMLASQLFEAAHQTSSSASSSSAYGSAVVGAAATTIMMSDGVEDGGHVDLEDVIGSLSSASPLNPSTIQNNLGAFRTFCFFWACAAAIGFIMSATAEGNKEVVLLSADSKSHAFEDEKKKHALEETKRKKDDGDDDGEGAGQSSISFTTFVSQTIRRAGMITVLIVWFLQDYSCTFATNFFSLFLTLVAAPHISPFARSVLLLISFIVPHIITIAATPFIPTLGKKFLVSLYLGIRTVVGVLFLFLIISLSGASSASSAPMLSASQTFVFATLLLLNRVLTEAVCRTQGLIISDVCDEDTIAFNRPASMAGAIHGLVNVVSRPSQSVSPVLSCLYLASYGVLMPKDEGGGEKGGGGGGAVSSYHGAISTAIPICKLLAVTIIVTTIVMQVVWRLYYNLDGSYLSSIRMQMAMRSGGKAQQRAEEGAVTPRKRRGSESAGGEVDAGGVLVAKRGGDLGQTVTSRPIQNRVGDAPLQGAGANSRASQII